MKSYRTSLLEPSTQAKEPDLVQKIRSGFSFDREKYLKWIDSIMEPVSAGEQAELREALQPYLEAMIADNPSLGAD